jgi:hypothetical protein
LLAKIEKNGTTGWESWWQVEFARFLQRHRDRHEWERKQPLEVNRTPRSKQDKLVVDFSIRPNNHGSGTSILLELKQSATVEGCIASMARDIRTRGKRTTVSNCRRSCWAVGVHPRECKNTVRKSVEAIAEEFGIRLVAVRTRYIPNTGYAFTVF